MNSFDFNRVYQSVFSTIARYIDIRGGRGRGGSHFGTDYFLFLITQPKYFRGVFMREVFNDIRHSLFRDFKDRIEEKNIDLNLFAINESTMSITYLPTGNSIISKGFKKSSGKQSAKLKSLAGCTHILIEECEEVSYDDFTQLDSSLRTTKADIQVIRIFNPPHKNHWLIKEYYNLTESKTATGYYEWTPKSRQDLLSVFSTYHQNRKNINEKTVELFEGFAQSNPEYYEIMIKGLVSEGKKGRIYKGWQPITDLEWEAIESEIICGLDFGYSNDPNAFLLGKKLGNNLYLKEGFYENGLSNSEIAEKIKQCGISNELIYCDHEAKSLEELKRLGLNTKQALKGAGSIKEGIKLIKVLNVFVTENSKNVWFEYEEYCWALNISKEPTDTPIDKNNHAMDVIRYIAYRKEVPTETVPYKVQQPKKTSLQLGL